MRLAVIEFTQHEAELTRFPDGAGQTYVERPQTYVEARLIDPPIDFAIGYGRSLSEAFTDLQSRVLDTAIYSARLLHDDPEEWQKRASQSSAETESGTEPEIEP